jgi:hypothetical protein
LSKAEPFSITIIKLHPTVNSSQVQILSTDEIVECVTLPPNAALLVDCTQAWYKSEHMKNRAPREELQVDNCLLSNDNWKSTARGLAM